MPPSAISPQQRLKSASRKPPCTLDFAERLDHPALCFDVKRLWEEHHLGLRPSLNLPIFDAGARVATVKAREAAAREAYLAWKETVLNAVSEVENALVAVSRTRQTVSALTATVRSYEEALSLATASYRDGASSLLDVLDAQRNVASAQANLAQAVTAAGERYVSLNVAIGGGYAWDARRPSSQASKLCIITKGPGPGTVAGPFL